MFRVLLLSGVLGGLCLAAGPVRVEIFENLPAASQLDPQAMTPSDQYQENAFAFVKLPAKFSANAIALDRSVPFVLRASYAREFAPGTYRFRLRARGLAAFSLDGRQIALTQAQKPNVSGDDPVPPPPVKSDSNLRPAAYPHQDIVVDLPLAAGSHQFTLVAVIGGKGLMPTPGELAVSYAATGKQERLLGPDGTPELTDDGWEAYVADQYRRMKASDREQRLRASAGVAAQWNARHEKIVAALRAQPFTPAPATGKPVNNAIDRYLGAALDAAKVEPTPLTSDLEFLRRVTLDTAGLIPAPEEIKAFLQDPPAVRRQRAIDRLLQDPSWADHWVSYWQDVLAENPGILKPDLNNTGPFRWWLHQVFTDNLPVDRMVSELIELQGSVHQGSPAAFGQATLNDAPMAAKADIISQAFLGQKLGCARCHDAPFHPYTQKDLFSIAAMLNGKELKLPKTSTVPMQEGGRKPNVKVTLKPGETIAPDWPFRNLAAHNEAGGIPETGAVPTRRELASLVVSVENTRFPQVIANRLWKRYMGRGLVEPADDWSRAKPTNPELLNYLSRELVLSGYDLKHVARLILSSHAYQRRPIQNSTDQSGEPGRLFAGPVRRHLTAEQLVDSLHRSVGKSFDCEELNLNPVGDRPPSQFLNMGKPERAWQLTALSNERDRPALALPIAQSLVDVMTAFGWRQSRQNPVTERDDAPSPMQTLMLANGILGTRMVRLSDDNVFTELSLRSIPVGELVQEAFLRILSRPPSADERKMYVDLLAPAYADRKVKDAPVINTSRKTDNRVSWSNHLSAEATLIRMEEERRLRLGDQPTGRLRRDFRERFEDTLWAMINSPEFVMVP